MWTFTWQVTVEDVNTLTTITFTRKVRRAHVQSRPSPSNLAHAANPAQIGPDGPDDVPIIDGDCPHRHPGAHTPCRPHTIDFDAISGTLRRESPDLVLVEAAVSVCGTCTSVMPRAAMFWGNVFGAEIRNTTFLVT